MAPVPLVLWWQRRILISVYGSSYSARVSTSQGIGFLKKHNGITFIPLKGSACLSAPRLRFFTLRKTATLSDRFAAIYSKGFYSCRAVLYVEILNSLTTVFFFLYNNTWTVHNNSQRDMLVWLVAHVPTLLEELSACESYLYSLALQTINLKSPLICF